VRIEGVLGLWNASGPRSGSIDAATTECDRVSSAGKSILLGTAKHGKSGRIGVPGLNSVHRAECNGVGERDLRARKRRDERDRVLEAISGVLRHDKLGGSSRQAGTALTSARLCSASNWIEASKPP
jgi:hypothetical protein